MSNFNQMGPSFDAMEREILASLEEPKIERPANA